MAASPRTEPDDDYWMDRCIALAAKGAGRVSPNPMVGAILVRGGKPIAKGYHRRFGGPHAEVECLKKVKGDLSGATLYVNLEPCSHPGKTPPCAPLIVGRGVSRVVAAMEDPNPLVRGRGIRILRRAGLGVRVGVREAEASQLNKFFIGHIRKKLPYVHLKIAQSLDGNVAARKGVRTQISSKTSQELVHRWRAEYDVVLVGAGTVRADNPRLNVRFAKGRDPGIVVVDGALQVNPDAKVFRSARRRNVYLITSKDALRKDPRKVSRLRVLGVRVIDIAGSRRIGVKMILKRLYAEGIGSILVEAGPDLFHQFRKSGCVDEMSLFISPKALPGGIPLNRSGDIGRGKKSIRFSRMTTALLDKDITINYTM